MKPDHFIQALNPRLAGVELYFDDLQRAQDFYGNVLGLPLTETRPAHHAKFSVGSAFVCLEKRGVENYRSADKAVVFIEVSDLGQAIQQIGTDSIVKYEPGASQPWAVIHDPEGHNVLLLQAIQRSA